MDDRLGGLGRLVLGAALAALALLAVPRPAGAQAKTTLLATRRAMRGWEAVGRLDIGETAFCSGTLVAPALVLTAAHCLVDPDTGERMDPRRTTFRAGLGPDGAVAVRRGTRAVLHPDYEIAVPSTRPRADFDAALLRLARPITGPAPVAAGRAGASLQLLSYQRGRRATLGRERGCHVVGRRARVLALDCAADFGASGAPVLSGGAGHRRIVAIVAGGVTREGRELVLAPAAAPALAALRRALATGEGVFPPRAGQPRRLRADAPGVRAGGAKFVRPDP